MRRSVHHFEQEIAEADKERAAKLEQCDALRKELNETIAVRSGLGGREEARGH